MGNHFQRPMTPGASRGFVPLLVAALSAGRAIAGAIDANQKKQRNKGYIDQAYRRSSQELDVRQSAAREGTAEDLNARGLAQGGSASAGRIHTAMRGGQLVATGAAPSTIGGQIASDAGVQMGLERQDLDQQHTDAKKANNAAYTNSLIAAGESGVQTAVNAYGAAKDVQGLQAPGGAATPNVSAGALPLPSYIPTSAPKLDRNSVHAAMLSATSFDGVHPNDPLGEPTSSWSTRLAVPGEANASFNVAG